MKPIKDLIKDDLTPLALILIGAKIIYDGYTAYGTTNMGFLQMTVGGIVCIAGVGWYFVQKELNKIKKELNKIKSQE